MSVETASRTVPNQCVGTRIEIEGRAYRAISFFHRHPSECPEENWCVLDHDGSKVLVDKVTMAVMAECQCEFLSREIDAESEEPSIVSVRLDPVKK